MEVVKDRVALIAGRADTLSEAIASRLIKGGAKVVLADSDAAGMEKIISRIPDAKGAISSVVNDPTNIQSIKMAASQAKERYGRLDILVNKFEFPVVKRIEALSDADVDASVKNLLEASIYFCRESIPFMRANKYGRIINMNGLDYLGWPAKSNYSAAASGLFGLTRSLALELAKDDITVNCLAKGDIGYPELGLTDEQAAKLAEGQPVKRLGTPDDIAYAVGFFASETSKYITGQTLFVCGGKSLYFSMSV
jgi:NAD(P)-dependent dehydrogenase (short-subunit alcohol dehydrogenase family)